MWAMMEKLRMWSIDLMPGLAKPRPTFAPSPLGEGWGEGPPSPRPSPKGEGGENQKGHAVRALLRCNILLHSCEPGIHRVDIEVVAADLDLPVQHHGDLVPPLLLELRVP